MTNQPWQERLEEFALINEMYIRGFPMSKLEALISELLQEEREKTIVYPLKIVLENGKIISVDVQAKEKYEQGFTAGYKAGRESAEKVIRSLKIAGPFLKSEEGVYKIKSAWLKETKEVLLQKLIQTNEK